MTFLISADETVDITAIRYEGAVSGELKLKYSCCRGHCRGASRPCGPRATWRSGSCMSVTP